MANFKQRIAVLELRLQPGDVIEAELRRRQEAIDAATSDPEYIAGVVEILVECHFLEMPPHDGADEEALLKYDAVLRLAREHGFRPECERCRAVYDAAASV